MKPKEAYTHYERIRILAARALQISQGAPVLVKTDGLIDPLQISRLEWEKSLIPIDTTKRVI